MSKPDGGPTPTLSVNVMINKQKSKVLFAEANSDFVDVLLSFLTLPLGKVVTILQENYFGEEAPVIGSLNTLYTGLYNLDGTHFCVPGAKQMLLNPASWLGAECRKLMLDITDTPPTQYFVCSDWGCLKYGYMNISMYTDIATCDCGRSLNCLAYVKGSDPDGDANGGVFTINPLSFVITDDFRVAPVVTGIMKTLKNIGITDTQGAELKNVSFGINEIIALLKLCLTSTTPLTDLILKKSSTAEKPEPGIFLPHPIQKGDEAKMVLKACLQKSTNKFLFAEATDEFLQFLLSFLTVPLGGVEFLLGGNTRLKNIDNLYRSVAYFIDDKYFKTPETKNKLINPKLAHGYVSKNQFIPLAEEGPPKLYYTTNRTGKRYETCFHVKNGSLVSSFKSCNDNYVNKQTVCFVTDDLTVNPSLAKSISYLNDLGIPLSDVKETELHIGIEEALGILRASLTSKTPLTDALINPMGLWPC